MFAHVFLEDSWLGLYALGYEVSKRTCCLRFLDTTAFSQPGSFIDTCFLRGKTVFENQRKKSNTAVSVDIA